MRSLIIASLASLIMALIALFAVFFVLGIGSVFGYVILEPVSKADWVTKSEARFHTADFFALSFVIALPTLFMTTVRESFGRDAILVDIVGWALIAVFAFACIREASSLSGIGVVDSRKRFTYLAVLLPIAIVGSAVGVPALIVFTFSLTSLSPVGTALWLTGAIIVIPAAWACRQCTLWVLSANDRATGESPGDSLDSHPPSGRVEPKRGEGSWPND